MPLAATTDARAGDARAGSRSRLVRVLLGFVLLLGLLVPLRASANNPAGFGGPARAIDPTFRPALLEFAEVEDEVWNQPISEIRFRGNRRVESEAMRIELDSNVGELVTPEKLRRDLKALWALGYFEDVSVEGE